MNPFRHPAERRRGKAMRGATAEQMRLNQLRAAQALEVKAMASMLRPMSAEEAQDLGWQEWWRAFSSPRQVARLQLAQARLCMPMREYLRCLQDLLGRPVAMREVDEPHLLWGELLRREVTPEELEHGAELFREHQMGAGF